MFHLEGHPSGIKEKIETQLAEKIESNDGIKVLLEFLKEIYDVNDMADSFDKYVHGGMPTSKLPNMSARSPTWF